MEDILTPTGKKIADVEFVIDAQSRLISSSAGLKTITLIYDICMFRY